MRASSTTLPPRMWAQRKWWIVATLCLTETISYGILYYAFTVFIKPMEAELGWSRADMTGAFSLSLLLSGLLAVPIGRLFDRHGSRALMTAGSVLGTLLLVAWSGVQDKLAFYAIISGIGIAGSLVFYEVGFATIVRWFEAGRRQALITVTLAAGFASTIFIPLAQWLIENQGWRTALLTLAAIHAIGTIAPHALVLRKSPPTSAPVPDQPSGERPSRSSTPREVLASTMFWGFAVALAFNTFVASAIGVHLVPYLTDQGHTGAFSANIAGLIGLMSFPTRLLYAAIADRIPHRLIMIGVLVLQPFAMLILITANTDLALIGFAAIYGAGNSAHSPVRATLLVDLYGVDHYATISGLLGIVAIFARGISPISMGLLRDATLTYQPVLAVLLLGAVVGAGLAVLVLRNALPLHPTVAEGR